MYFSSKRVSEISERATDSSERTASEAADGLLKGEKEGEDSPARQIPSLIGPAEAERAKALRQNRRMKQIERI